MKLIAIEEHFLSNEVKNELGNIADVTTLQVSFILVI